MLINSLSVIFGIKLVSKIRIILKFNAMKNFILLLVSVFLFASCSTSKKYLEKGNYDMAVRKSVEKLRKKPSSKKNIVVLDKAYPLANNIDKDRINYLKQEGKPENWDEIFGLYSNLADRQKLVKTVLPLNLEGKNINYPQIDYNAEVINAKRNAAEYYYAHAQKLMQKNTKQDYREAYYDFKRVKDFYANYENTDVLIQKCKEMGISWVLVQPVNKSIYKLTNDYLQSLITVDLPKFNTEWLQYTEKNIYQNDYFINVTINKVEISAERVKEEQEIDSKEITDGWDYFLDSKGNVLKDSAGNDIKKQKYKPITCKVYKTFQNKVAHLEGSVIFTNALNGQVLKTVPISADNVFDNLSATALGDLNAVTPEHKKIIGLKPVPFPRNEDMIQQATITFKQVISNALNDNKYFLK